MRLFTILVRHHKKGWLRYPATQFKIALNALDTLIKRGFEVKVETSANGITEEITYKQMIELSIENEKL